MVSRAAVSCPVSVCAAGQLISLIIKLTERIAATLLGSKGEKVGPRSPVIPLKVGPTRSGGDTTA